VATRREGEGRCWEITTIAGNAVTMILPLILLFSGAIQLPAVYGTLAELDRVTDDHVEWNKTASGFRRDPAKSTRELMQVLENKAAKLRLRGQAISVLGNVLEKDAKESAGLLLAIGRDKEEPAGLRTLALRSLAKVQNQWDSKSVAPLRTLLSDDNENIRTEAARLLGFVGQDAQDAVADLLPMIEEDTQQVAYFACFAVSRIAPESEEVIDALLAALSGTRRTGALEAILHTKADRERVTAVLREQLEKEKGANRRTVIAMISRLRKSAAAAVPDLLEIAMSTDAHDRVEAITALAHIAPRDAKVRARIQAAMSDEVPFVRGTAKDAIEIIEEDLKEGKVKP
jgi:hypothetical protein